MRRKHDRKRERQAGRGRGCGRVASVVLAAICEAENDLAESCFTPSEN
jgi:hypothetical protein